MSAAPRSIGVLICTYRRPESLGRCLAALAAQERRPDEVIVVVRDSDAATHDWLASCKPDGLRLRVVGVTLPGTVAALNTGLDSCRTDILAITDDDTAPRPDWLARILEHFTADPRLGGLGGRDRCHDGARFDDRQRAPVGRLQWFGRMIGNHHLGFGAARPAAMLKGANMSYRRRAVAGIRFDARLRGTGAQPYEDIAFSLAVARSGWRLVYDPRIVVDHFTGRRDEPRHYVSVSALADVEGFRTHAFNGVVALWDELSPPRHAAFLLWSLLIGTGPSPGLAQALRYTPRLGAASWQRFWVAQQGKAAAYRSLLRGARAARRSATPRNSASSRSEAVNTAARGDLR
jgi:cellulose synthase/poly-beta-1,6-N-acetylglucosamine synthase-like glycosyltransferase